MPSPLFFKYLNQSSYTQPHCLKPVNRQLGQLPSQVPHLLPVHQNKGQEPHNGPGSSIQLVPFHAMISWPHHPHSTLSPHTSSFIATPPQGPGLISSVCLHHFFCLATLFLFYNPVKVTFSRTLTQIPFYDLKVCPPNLYTGNLISKFMDTWYFQVEAQEIIKLWWAHGSGVPRWHRWLFKDMCALSLC